MPLPDYGPPLSPSSMPGRFHRFNSVTPKAAGDKFSDYTSRRRHLKSMFGSCLRPGSIDHSPRFEADTHHAFDLVDKKWDSKELNVQNVDMLGAVLGDTKLRHHTEEFDHTNLVVRRGEPFSIRVTLSNVFNPSEHNLRIELCMGFSPKVNKGTLVSLPVTLERQQDYRGAWLRQGQGSCVLDIEVTLSPECLVGRFELYLVLMGADGKQRSKRVPETDIYVLFNPWCPDDSVYMESDLERTEYVLNETGIIFQGTQNQISSRPWVYGQFNAGILDACLFLLDKGQQPYYGRGDPVNIVRVVSALINFNDDKGILVGKWTGNYRDGISPNAWTGSEEILLQFHKTGKAVCYGQCWVFAAVSNTVFRCLGIPSRVVTNFSSAHDTDKNLTTDVFLDKNMRPIENLNTDSIWNFHVWNEVWMERRDLKSEYGGWQAIDATPQETSQGFFRCGPASVNAIKQGHVHLQYDTPFLFAEVNSDRIYWMQQDFGHFTQLNVEERVVGQYISTKAVGSDERNDITHHYKYKEGSGREREAVKTACQYGLLLREGSAEPDVTECPDSKAIVLTVRVKPGVELGGAVTVALLLFNQGKVRHTLDLRWQTEATHYTGVRCGRVAHNDCQIELQPREEIQKELLLKPDNYMDQLSDHSSMLVTVTGFVHENGQVLTCQHSFELQPPVINVVVPDNIRVGMKCTLRINYVNPVPQTLRLVVFRLEGPGIVRPHAVPHRDIPQRGKAAITIRFVPYKPGTFRLVVSLSSIPLVQSQGGVLITVLP
uniref:protein-glutamine gamma-glutamyltransferase K-like n=1 Tax=Myxine glutinosa TaxID=7769 RepID=UPI00358FA8DA